MYKMFLRMIAMPIIDRTTIPPYVLLLQVAVVPKVVPQVVPRFVSQVVPKIID